MIIADRIQAYLIENSIGRDPRDGTNMSLPPIWRQPADGTPAPREGEGTAVGQDAVIGLIHTNAITAARFESEFRRTIIDIWYRTLTWPRNEELYSACRRLLIDKFNWQMAGLRVIESQEWRGHQMLESDSGQGYTGMSSVLFQCYDENMT